VKHANLFGLADAHDLAFRHRDRTCETHLLSDQAALAKKRPGLKDRGDRFVALRGRDHDLYLAFLQVVDRVRGRGLPIDDSAAAVVRESASAIYDGKKCLWIEVAWDGFATSPAPCQALVAWRDYSFTVAQV
jgi:hypothetical protein